MDYSYNAAVERIRNLNARYMGLEWPSTASQVTKYPNLVAWIDAHGNNDGSFRWACDVADLRPSELVDVIINGKALTDEQITVLSQIAKLPASIWVSDELEAMEDEYIPELLAESFETCWAECAPYNRNWIDAEIAVGTYYDLKQGIKPPFVYWDNINYVMMRNRRYRSV